MVLMRCGQDGDAFECPPVAEQGVGAFGGRPRVGDQLAVAAGVVMQHGAARRSPNRGCGCRHRCSPCRSAPAPLGGVRIQRGAGPARGRRSGYEWSRAAPRTDDMVLRARKATQLLRVFESQEIVLMPLVT